MNAAIKNVIISNIAMNACFLITHNFNAVAFAVTLIGKSIRRGEKGRCGGGTGNISGR